MLQKLTGYIRDCLERAASAEARASSATDSRIKVDYLEMAKHWRQLARSYEFVETLERFLLDAERRRTAIAPKPDGNERP
jgi:hypothetical protein